MTLEQLQSQLVDAQGFARLALLHQILEALYQTNPQEMLTYLDEALQLAKDLNDQGKLAQTYLYQGMQAWIAGKQSEALAAYMEAQELYTLAHNYEGLAVIYSRIAIVYEKQGDYDRALEQHIKALQIREKLGNQDQLVSSYMNLGTLHFRMDDYARALEYYLKAQVNAEALGGHAQLPQIYGNIGISYTHLGELDKGLVYLQKTLAISLKNNNRRTLVTDYINLGDAFYRLGRYQEALESQHKALEVCQEIGYRNVLPYIYVNLGQAYTELQDYPQATTYLLQAIEVGQSIGDMRIQIEAYKVLSDVHVAQQEYQQALDYYKQYSQLKDEVFSETRSQQLAKLQTRYETEKQTRESEIYRLKNVELVRMNEALERGNREKNQFLKVIAHQLQNPLAGMVMNANMLANYHTQLTPEQVSDRIARIERTAKMMTEIVDQILDLRLLKEGKANFEIDVVALDNLTQELVESYRERAAAKNITLHYTPQTVHVFADSVALKQIIDNLLSNALKYTYPQKNVYISIEERDGFTFLRVRDEGQGLTSDDQNLIFNEFSTLSAKPTGGERATGLGLAIVKMLIEGMAGRIRAESPGKDQGTTFSIELKTAPRP